MEIVSSDDDNGVVDDDDLNDIDDDDGVVTVDMEGGVGLDIRACVGGSGCHSLSQMWCIKLFS